MRPCGAFAPISLLVLGVARATSRLDGVQVLHSGGLGAVLRDGHPVRIPSRSDPGQRFERGHEPRRAIGGHQRTSRNGPNVGAPGRRRGESRRPDPWPWRRYKSLRIRLGARHGKRARHRDQASPRHLRRDDSNHRTRSAVLFADPFAIQASGVLAYGESGSGRLAPGRARARRKLPDL